MGIVEGVAIALLGVVVVMGLLAWRRFRLVRSGGVDLAIREPATARRWRLGVGQYRGDHLVWFRVVSLRVGPNHVLDRRGLGIHGRRNPSGQEAYALPAGSIVLHCRSPEREFEIAMGPEALTGFLSWLESTPPGRSLPWVS